MSDVVLVAVIAALASITAAVLAFVNTRRIQELHVLINSNLAQQIAAEVAAAFAKGQIDGARIERERKELNPRKSVTRPKR